MSYGKYLIFLAVFAFFLLASGCESSNGEFFFGDSEESAVQSCTPGQHYECDRSGENWLCSADGQCFEIGECSSDEQCRTWRPDATQATCIIGVCSWSGGGVPGDEDPSELPYADEDDELETLLGCGNWKGVYEGEICGDEVKLYVDLDEECRGVVSIPALNATGVANENGRVEFSNGCTATRAPGGVHLSCLDCTSFLSKVRSEYSGLLGVSESSINFGIVPYMESHRRSLVLYAVDGPVEIAEWRIESEYSFEFDPDMETAPPLVVEEDSPYTLNITYTNDQQTSCGENTGVLWIYTHSADTPIVTVFLRPDNRCITELHLSTTELDFGEVSSDSYKVLNFSISFENVTEYDPLIIESIEFLPTEDGQGLENAEGAFFLLPFDESNEPPLHITSSSEIVYTVFCQPNSLLHHPGDTLSGTIRVTYENYNIYDEPYKDLALTAQVTGYRPACIDVNPDEGILNLWSGVEPGPGIDFGIRPVEELSRRTLEIENCGDEILHVSQILYNGPVLPAQTNPFGLEIPTGSFQIAPRQSLEIPVSFYPPSDDSQEYGVVFTIDSNAEEADGIEPTRMGNCFEDSDCNVFNQYCICEEGSCACVDSKNVKFGLRGQGGSSDIRIEPSSIDCGKIGTSCSSIAHEVSIFNTGNLPYTISDIGFSQESNPHFSLQALPSLPQTLSENGSPSSMRFEVVCHPQTLGNIQETIQIDTDQDGVHHDIGLAVEGITGTGRTETFVLPEQPKVDMLWVIDGSGSMSEEQAALRENSEAFIQQAVASGADVRIAVTGMSLEENGGALIGDPAIIRFGALDNSGMSANEAIAAFSDNVQDVYGSDTERAFDAAIAALGLPRPGENQEPFLREDAVLSVVFVSDEDDQSPGDVEFYVDYFQSLKGPQHLEMVQFFAIVGDARYGCSTSEQGATASAGDRYIEVADRCNTHAGTHFLSICEEDWSDIFEPIGDVLFSFTYVHMRTYALGQTPVPGSLAVLVDGNGWDTNWWLYDSVLNAVRFTENHHPAPGSTVAIAYQVSGCSR